MRLFSKDVVKLGYPLFLANMGVAASQVNNAIDPLFALFADSEGPAWLWYAIRIQQLPLALFGIALSSALLPPLSRAIKSGERESFFHFFSFAKRRIASLMIPISAGMCALAPSCINLLFGRGRFDLDSVAGSALCLLGYGVGLFPMAFVLIAAPTLYALGDFKTPARSSMIAMIFSTVLNFFCIFVLGLGAASVAFATSCAAAWNALYLNGRVQSYLTSKEDFKASFLATSSAALLAVGMVFLMDLLLLGEIPLWNLITNRPLPLTQDFLNELFLFGAESSTFLAALLAGAWLFNAQDILGWIQKPAVNQD
jgi:putative peptidoglycan lipid II flippase